MKSDPQTAHQQRRRALQVIAGKTRRFIDRCDLSSEPRYPFLGSSDGIWRTTGIEGWTIGFFPGLCRLIDTALPNTVPDEALRHWLDPLRQLEGWANHGVKTLTAFAPVPGEPLSPRNARTLARAAEAWSQHFHAQPGVFGRPLEAETIWVIIDWLYDINLLLEAPAEDALLETMARHHLEAAIRAFVRPDGSTFQEAVFDTKTGEFLRHRVRQGLALDSTWSRGQAWAVYGLSRAALNTGDRQYLEIAARTADVYLHLAGTDARVPWDFNATGSAARILDSSAAALACAGLFLLSRQLDRYRIPAEELLSSLLEPDLFEWDPNNECALKLGTYHYHKGETNQPTIWGDFFLTQSLFLSSQSLS